jgi:hypothetical protein
MDADAMALHSCFEQIRVRHVIGRFTEIFFHSGRTADHRFAFHMNLSCALYVCIVYTQNTDVKSFFVPRVLLGSNLL